MRFGYADRAEFLGPIDVSAAGGACWAIVGPNGAGKSTLLRLLAGLRRPSAGAIMMDGVSLTGMSPRQRARRIAFVPQQSPVDPLLTARDVVLMGRYPHRGFSLFESPDDRRIAEAAMRATQTDMLADRRLATLSGGEAQRVHVAAALAQRPCMLLLDEPTTSLDLKHQVGTFRILADLARRGGLLVMVVTHDVNLAARFCTHVVLLSDGKQVATGPPADVITPDVLEPVYGVTMMTLSDAADPERRWVVPVDVAGRATR